MGMTQNEKYAELSNLCREAQALVDAYGTGAKRICVRFPKNPYRCEWTPAINAGMEDYAMNGAQEFMAQQSLRFARKIQTKFFILYIKDAIAGKSPTSASMLPKEARDELRGVMQSVKEYIGEAFNEEHSKGQRHEAAMNVARAVCAAKAVIDKAISKEAVKQVGGFFDALKKKVALR